MDTSSQPPRRGAWLAMHLGATVLAMLLVAAVLPRLRGWAGSHSTLKMVLIVWDSLLLHRWGLAAALLACAALALLLRARPRWAWIALIPPLVLAPPKAPLLWLAVMALAFAQRLAPERWPRRLAWALLVPGTALLLPLPSLRALGWGFARRRGPALAALALPLGLLAATMLDRFAEFPAWEEDLLFHPWPAVAGMEVVEHTEAPVKHDYQDVDVVGDRVIVVAEGSLRLIAWDRDLHATTWALPPHWDPDNALVMEAETDATGHLTWYVAGPHSVIGLRWTEGGWAQVVEAQPVIWPWAHVALTMVDRPNGAELLVYGVAAQGDSAPLPWALLRLPAAQVVSTGRFDEHPFRRVTWVPPLQAFLGITEFGPEIFILDPASTKVDRWMDLGANPGALLWVPAWQRLLVACPARPWMAVVDPATRTVECRIPTQPGTRTVAVDAARGLIVSGSMLTGEVLVQAPDGHVVRHFGPAMPMMRDVALDEEVGHAWLGTWTALYRFDYAGGMVPGVDALGPCQ